MKNHDFGKFSGLVKMGKRGTVVIPIEVRKALDLKAGDNLMAFQRQDFGLVLFKTEHIKKMLEFAMQKMGKVKELLDEDKKDE